MTKLINLLNQSRYSFYFLVVDKFLDISLPLLSNFESISLNSVKNSGQLLSSSKTITYIQNNSKGRKVAIVPFKPSAKIDHICHQYSWINVSNPAKINRLLEDKIKFLELCQQNQLPVVPSIITTLLPNTFQPNSVIQTHFGWAGKNTYQFTSYQQATKKIPPNTPIKISPFLNGYTITNNCCLTNHGLIQSPPALQLTGIKPYTDNPFATVGRQWPAPIPDHIAKSIAQITTNFSKRILLPLQYQGFFGLDFLVSDNQIYLLECNPRLTASFAFYTKLEMDQNITPLFLFHLLQFLDLEYKFDLQQEQKRLNAPIVGTELTPKNALGKIIDQIHYSKPLITNPSEKTLN